MLKGFLVPVVGFHRPATPVQGDNRGAGKAAQVDKVGQQHRDGAIGSFQANGAEAKRGKGPTLGWGERALERIRGVSQRRVAARPLRAKASTAGKVEVAGQRMR